MVGHQGGAQRDGSTVKSAPCFARGPELVSQHPHWEAFNYL